ncbi:MAG: amino acid adenylation domain-containing protein [Clostridia bacterium]|nr:amino acid adenylation domain-containing protein [Clostridia bacterium]
MINNVLDFLYNTALTKPDKTAFVMREDSYTFKELKDEVQKIGAALADKGCNKEPVIIFMDKHPKELAAFWGTVAAGCYYVPIDSEMPGARIDLILQSSEAKFIIADSNNIDKAKSLANFSGEILLYDDLTAHNLTQDDTAKLEQIKRNAIDTDPIYIVFTSGTTGIPKGITACHRSVIDYAVSFAEELKLDENCIFANQAPLYFDAYIKDVYPTVMFGATTHMVPKQLFMFPVKLVEFLNENKVNTLCWAVSALTIISQFKTFNTVKPEYVNKIAFVGEVFPTKQFKIWQEALPKCEFTNLYGPTETTGVCCYYHVNKKIEDGDIIPIGRPFKNTGILLLKDDGTEANEGEEGEICVRGTCVTLGYYNNPSKTAENFVPNPLNRNYTEIIYKTGDLARMRDDGNLIFVSRKDFQIKHMGQRIELGEIEANVDMVDGIDACCCVYNQEKDKIVLFYVGTPEVKELSSLLRTKLQPYMLPNFYRKLDAIPLTPNGKKDRNLLKSMM